MNDTNAPESVAHLRNAGKRITRERTLLLRIVEQNAHLDAEEIYRIAQQELPQIGLATVYRTLNLLTEIGIVRSSDLGENHSHYELQSEEHVHLVCSECNLVTDIPVPRALATAARKAGFTVQRTHFEMFGICQSCAAKMPNASSENHA